VNDGTVVQKHKRKKRKTNSAKDKHSSASMGAIAMAISDGNVREAKMAALRLLFEFGSEEDKSKAREELCTIAYDGLGSQKEKPQVDLTVDSDDSSSSED
jgi:hypothetical protein